MGVECRETLEEWERPIWHSSNWVVGTTYRTLEQVVSQTVLVVHQFWIDGYKDFNFMRASAVVKRQSTFMAS